MLATTLLHTGHADRAVSFERRGDRIVVCKHYRDADAEAVYHEMTALWNSPFGRRDGLMPRPAGLAGSTVSMSHIPGEPLAVRGTLGSTGSHCRGLVELLIGLHDSGVVVTRRRSGGRIVRSLQRKLPTAPAVLASCFGSALDELADAVPPVETLVVNHGDFSPRNVLVASDAKLVLIDFDRLQMAGRGRDLGYLGAWVHATQRMSGVIDWSLADRLLSQYASRVPAAADELHAAAAFHRAAGLLRIATTWSALADQPALAGRLINAARALIGGPR